MAIPSCQGLELFSIMWSHMIDKKICKNNGIERQFRSWSIGIRSILVVIKRFVNFVGLFMRPLAGPWDHGNPSLAYFVLRWADSQDPKDQEERCGRQRLRTDYDCS